MTGSGGLKRCACGHPLPCDPVFHSGVTLVNILRSWVGYMERGVEQRLTEKSGDTLRFMLTAAENLMAEFSRSVRDSSLSDERATPSSVVPKGTL